VPTAATHQALTSLGIRSKSLDPFYGALRDSAAPSIDSFLEHRPEFMEIGKAHIAYHLIQREDPGTLNSTQPSGKWYDYLFRLVASCPFDQLCSKEQLAILTFNYDRSLEFWLRRTIQAQYGKTQAETIEVLRRLPIIHVYGSLGVLPGGEGPSRDYEPEVTTDKLRIAMAGIRIISEGQAESPPLTEARRQLRSASHVVFLGFGYHPENVKRLDLRTCCSHRHSGPTGDAARNRGIPDSAQIRGTAYGFTESEKTHMVNRLFGPYHSIDLADSGKDVRAFLRDSVELFVEE